MKGRDRERVGRSEGRVVYVKRERKWTKREGEREKERDEKGTVVWRSAPFAVRFVRLLRKRKQKYKSALYFWHIQIGTHPHMNTHTHTNPCTHIQL